MGKQILHKNVDKWNVEEGHKANYYRAKELFKIERFFEPVILLFNKDYDILEIGSGCSFNLGYLKGLGFNNVYGIECSLKRVLYGSIDFPDIPIFYNKFKYDKRFDCIDVLYTHSALFLNRKNIVKDIYYCNPKYFGCYENQKMVKWDINKEFKKLGFELIYDKNVDNNGVEFTIKWFKLGRY